MELPWRPRRVGHTDLHAAEGDWPVKPAPPFIPGHEGAGIVTALGRGAMGIKEGDRVGIPWLHALAGTATTASAAGAPLRGAVAFGLLRQRSVRAVRACARCLRCTSSGDGHRECCDRGRRRDHQEADRWRAWRAGNRHAFRQGIAMLRRGGTCSPTAKSKPATRWSPVVFVYHCSALTFFPAFRLKR